MNQKLINVTNSYKRCFKTDEQTHQFYMAFRNSHPLIRLMSINEDDEKQKRRLKKGIALIMSFAQKDDFAVSGFQKFKNVQERSSLIKDIYYNCWKDGFLKAISEMDSQYSDQLGEDWDAVLQHAIDFVSPSESERNEMARA